MTSRRFVLAVLTILFSFRAAVGYSDDPPNIILIVADDLGWSGLGCYGSRFYETPNIDRLATEGIRFASAYSAAANCAPSRATIMSGQYTPSHGILYVGSGTYQKRYREKNGNLKKFRMLQPPGKTELPPKEKLATLAESLKENGYRTGFFGKWHLGTNENHPGSRGFDVAIESHGKHFGFHTDPEIDHTEGEYLSDFLSDQAVKFIRDSANNRVPYFLYYADFLVHKPLEAKQSLLEHFGNKRPSENQKSPVAAAMIKSLDDSVGKILSAIDTHPAGNNTLIVFTSDNGGLAYEEDGARDQNTSNLPLRGRKGSEYEGGYRVPWIVRWPERIAPGTVSDTPVHHVDIYPTLLALADAKPPRHKLHGVDLLPLLRGESEGVPERALFWYLPGYSAFHQPSVIVRRGQWKLIESLETRTPQLFNLARDIGERIDHSDQHPKVVSELSALANSWLDDLNAPRMTPNPEFQQ